MSISMHRGGSLLLLSTQVTKEKRKSHNGISVTDGVQAYVNETIAGTEQTVPLSKFRQMFFPCLILNAVR
jgi:hypothetical protein